MRKNLVVFRLPTYNYIFSDFDPRAFSERGLSDDFLKELQKAASEADETFTLSIELPAAQWDEKIDHVISERLHAHFKKHAALLSKEYLHLIKKGASLTVFGFLLIVAATVTTHYEDRNLLLSFLRVMLEPAGWFISWLGLDHIFYISRKNLMKRNFYQKLNCAKITFASY